MLLKVYNAFDGVLEGISARSMLVEFSNRNPHFKHKAKHRAAERHELAQSVRDDRGPKRKTHGQRDPVPNPQRKDS